MNIFPNSDYTKVYTGSQIPAQYLQAVLEDAKIPCIVRDDGESARRGGFAISYLNEVVLLVNNKDVLKAKQLIAKALDEMGS